MSDRLEIRITGNAANATAAMQKISTEAKSMGLAVEQSSTTGNRGLTGLQKGFTALGASVGAAAIILGEFGRKAAEDEASQARVQQAIENTGAAYDEYADRVERAIRVGQEKAFTDDQTRDAITRLIGSTGDASVAINELGLVMDFARARGIDLSTSADIIGKVYGGNLGILTRYGIQLDENTTKEEALAIIQERSAGQAQTYADTTAGDIDILKDKIDETTEAWGRHAGALTTVVALLPGISVGWGAITGAAGGLTTAIAGEAGAAGAMALLGGSITTLGAAALIAAPGIAALGYTLVTATDNIHAVTKETDALNASLAAGGLEADEYARRIYGLVSQGMYNVEYLDPATERVFTLEEMFGRLVSLQGEFQRGFIDSAEALHIDFANPAAQDIQNLIALILYFKQLQTETQLSAGAGLSYGGKTGLQFDPRSEAGRRYAQTSNIDRSLQVRAAGSVSDLESGQQATLDKATALEKSLGAATQGVNSWSQAQAEADRQLRQSLGGWYEFATGVQTSGAAIDAFKAAQDGLIDRESVYGQQISEFTQQQNALTAAYDVLTERKSEGIALSAQEQELLDKYPQLLDRVTGGVDDATVSQGLLAAAYIENMSKGDQLNETMRGNTESTGELVSIIRDLILSLDGVPEEVRSRLELDGAQEAIDKAYELQAALSLAAGTYVASFIVNQVGGNAPSGPQFANGGVVGYAGGGVLVRAGEAGPELFSTPYGRDGLIVNDGLYNFPRGTIIDSAVSTKSKLAGGGGQIVIHGDLHLHMHDANVYQAVREAAIGSSR